MTFSCVCLHVESSDDIYHTIAAMPVICNLNIDRPINPNLSNHVVHYEDITSYKHGISNYSIIPKRFNRPNDYFRPRSHLHLQDIATVITSFYLAITKPQPYNRLSGQRAIGVCWIVFRLLHWMSNNIRSLTYQEARFRDGPYNCSLLKSLHALTSSRIVSQTYVLKLSEVCVLL